MLQGKHVVLGVTGSIAAYKACLLTRQLVRSGAEVQVVMTPAAREFVGPLTFSTLTHKSVVSEFFDRRDGTWHSHVDLGLWADVMVVAPATAATIAKMAHGVADNMLVTTYLSMRAPVVVAPAMDLDMYAHAATQHNLATLRSRGVRVIEPGTGFLASTLEGKGRMEEPERIAAAVDELLRPARPESVRLLLTAGPTQEPIDPVRYIGNRSTGRMGIALARAAAGHGMDVDLVCGPVAESLLGELPPSVSLTRVDTAAQMGRACAERFPQARAAILCAAVADFAPQAAAHKIKREAGHDLTLTLHPTTDIAATLGRTKQPGQVLAGFALETDHEAANAEGKLARKRFDFIVLNSLRDQGAGFGTPTNKVTILHADGRRDDYPLKPKAEVAEDIIGTLEKYL